MLNVAVIGCGNISRRHVRAWQASGRARVVAVCDADRARAEAVAGELGVERLTVDYTELLADEGLDAVDLCLPHHLHRPVAVAALEAGRHVLCQKPIATSLADADAMIAAAEASGRVLAIAEAARFNPLIAAIREPLAAGLLGRPIAYACLSAYWQGGAYLETPWRFAPEQMGGGALIDGGIHTIDLLQALFGPPRAVNCFSRTIREIFPAEDTALLNLVYPDGLLGHLTIHWSARHTPYLLQISGTEGTLTAGRREVTVTSDWLPEPLVRVVEPVDGFAALCADFLDAVATDQPPALDGRSARADLEVVLAAYAAERAGRTVTLPLEA